MAIKLYPNGITEEIYPVNYVFTEKELLSHFEEYDKIGSYRILKIVNSWLIWGEKNDPEKYDEEFYNKIISRFLKKEIYSPVIFIHDSEINPDWKLTDDIIHFGYDDFIRDVNQLLDDIANEIINENNKLEAENQQQQKMYLKQIGISNDKRIIFEIDPKEQPDIFYSPEIFSEFANKIVHFFKTNYNVSDNFSLFADKNIIISVQKNNVELMINKLIHFFNEQEKYEDSKIIAEVYNGWLDYTTDVPKTKNNKTDNVKPTKRKRGRPRKNKSNE